jgi:hypothetical protein
MLRVFAKKVLSPEQAQRIGEKIGIDWSAFSPEDLAKGIIVELEHGSHDPQTDVTHNNLIESAKIAWAHLKSCPKYYYYLLEMEKKHGCED